MGKIESFKVTAVVPSTQKAGVEFIAKYDQAKNKGPWPITVGKGMLFGGFWIVRESDVAPVGRITSVITDKGEKVDDLADFAAKVNPDYWKTSVVEVSERQIVLNIVHEVDDDAVIDSRTGAEISKAVTELVRKKVAEGIVDEAGANERISYMKMHGAEDDLLLRVVEQWLPNAKKLDKPNPLYIDQYLDTFKKKHWDGVVVQCLKYLVAGNSILLKGPRASGKLVLVYTLAWLRCQGVETETGSADATSEMKDGYLTTDNSAAEWLLSEEAMKMAFQAETGDRLAKAELNLRKTIAISVKIKRLKSKICKAALDKNIFNLEEINYLPPEVGASMLNSVLDGHHVLSVPGEDDIQLEPPFAVIATMNEGYAGTQPLNDALKSRFRTIVLEFPKSIRGIIEASAKAELEKIGMKGVAIRKDLLDQAEQLYNALYKATTTPVHGSSATVTDEALNIREFAAAISVCMQFKGSRLAQYLTGVANACELDDRPILKNMISDTVTL